MLSKFPRILRELREEKEWSIKDLANALNVSESLVRKWESTNPDNKRDPGTEQLIKISDLFGVSIDYLLGKNESPTMEQYIEANLEEINKKYGVLINGKTLSVKQIKNLMDIIETLKRI